MDRQPRWSAIRWRQADTGTESSGDFCWPEGPAVRRAQIVTQIRGDCLLAQVAGLPAPWQMEMLAACKPLGIQCVTLRPEGASSALDERPFEADNGQGLAVWLSQTSSGRMCVHCRLRTDQAVAPGARVILHADRTIERGFVLSAADQHDLEGEVEIDGWQPVDSAWRVEVVAGDPREAPPLTDEDFRQLPCSTREVIPLESALRDSQRLAWLDPACVQFVQLLRRD